MEESRFLNRELSWLDFNERVMDLALDQAVPLLERVRFAAIASANLDEFFQVRVAALRDQIAAGVDETTPDGRTAVQQVEAIGERVSAFVHTQERQIVILWIERVTDRHSSPLSMFPSPPFVTLPSLSSLSPPLSTFLSPPVRSVLAQIRGSCAS